jgi:hypothetical protein
MYRSDEDVHLLVDKWGFAIEKTSILLSLAGYADATQSCHLCPEPVIASMRITKIFIYPTPFRKK